MSLEVDGMQTNCEPMITRMAEFATGTSPVQKWLSEKLPKLPWEKKGGVPDGSFKGEGGSLTPRLDMIKKAFK